MEIPLSTDWKQVEGSRAKTIGHRKGKGQMRGPRLGARVAKSLSLLRRVSQGWGRTVHVGESCSTAYIEGLVRKAHSSVQKWEGWVGQAWLHPYLSTKLQALSCANWVSKLTMGRHGHSLSTTLLYILLTICILFFVF